MALSVDVVFQLIGDNIFSVALGRNAERFHKNKESESS